MEVLLPKFIVIQSNVSGQYLRYLTEPEEAKGFVTNGEPNVFNIFAKIEVESTDIDDGRFVHLRFCHSNKYFAKEVGGSSRLCATRNQQEQNRSESSCTLFEPFQHSDGNMSFRHVQSGLILASPPPGEERVVFADGNGRAGTVDEVRTSFKVVDRNEVVVLPKHVTFKADNDNYLKSTNSYLEVTSEDGNEIATGYEVTMTANGHIRVRSKLFNRFWRRNPNNWLVTDSSDTSNNNRDTLFWPVKVSGNIIGLRNAGNNRFCRRSVYRNVSYISTSASTITQRARLEVEELVFDRNIYDVRFRMEDARIYDERAIIAGTKSAENNSDEAASSTINFKYEDQKSSSFTNSFSVTAGITTTFTTGVPFIAKGQIEVSAETTYSREWNTTTTETRSVEATYRAEVQPRSRIVVEYVATVGKCDVPFSYKQRDRFSHDGRAVTTQHNDGIYTGVNYYSFHFTQPRVETL